MTHTSRARFVLASATALSTVLFLGALPARAQSRTQPSADQLGAIEAQIKSLQSELKQLRAEAARSASAAQQAKADAAQAQAQVKAQPVAMAPTLPAAVAALPAGTGFVTIPPHDPNKPNGTFNLGGVTVSLGGYAELTGIGRSVNETRGTSTSFSGIPFRQSQSGDVGEFRMSAQTTRLSLRFMI